MKYVLLAALLLAQTCFGQTCPSEASPNPDSAFAYARAEIKALQSIRQALAESQKIPPPVPSTDPDRMEKASLRNTIAKGLATYYDCAAQFVAPYKDSKNGSVNASANALLNGIRSSKDVNDRALKGLQAMDKAPIGEEPDPDVMKRLVDLAKVEESARNMITGGVKMSTYGLVRLDTDPDEPKPIAFLITAKQLQNLLADARDLASKKSNVETYVDTCAEILLSTLTRNLPTLPASTD
jgi:hypothetical protein